MFCTSAFKQCLNAEYMLRIKLKFLFSLLFCGLELFPSLVETTAVWEESASSWCNSSLEP